MPTEPHKHDLLGFPGVEAQHPKCYIRMLWLVASNDRKEFPEFLDNDVCELAVHVNEVVNTLVKDADKRYEELCSDSFLERAAAYILDDKGFGRRIWGQHNEAEVRLQSNLPGARPLWGVKTDGGYEKNDEDNIRLNLRCWMAARIQAKINAPCKDRQREPLKTTKKIQQILPPRPARSRQRRPEQEPSSQLSRSASVSSQPKHNTHLSVPIVDAHSEADSASSSKRAHSDESDSSFSFGPFLGSKTEADFQPKSKEPKRLRRDGSRHESHAGSPPLSSEATLTADASLLSDLSTNITLPDVRNVNITDIDNGDPSSVDQIKKKLQLDLVRFLNNKPDYPGILSEIIPFTKHLYAIGPHRKPCSDLEIDFKNFNRALEHWESLITTITATAGATQSPPDDPLQELAAQGTFEDRVAMLHNCGPRSQIDFPFERWTISLALFFEVVYFIGQFLKVDSTLLEAKTAAGVKEKIRRRSVTSFTFPDVTVLRSS
ncbi:stomatin family protein [Stemphylium lycopersici]|uniref:Stomatin family protein n=1 Tax=Stemphylium lycopersici TaxID=183478 RepID=A0A364MT40_STELY|nr:hypothetical protein TW65_05469 [Stemphylium lycopersici]RAQ98852.1 stomatin family protein [Stemphylium lycopersici]RAR02760.1 stomatin family protein [Stemphylium lycopersici]